MEDAIQEARIGPRILPVSPSRPLRTWRETTQQRLLFHVPAMLVACRRDASSKTRLACVEATSSIKDACAQFLGPCAALNDTLAALCFDEDPAVASGGAARALRRVHLKRSRRPRRPRRYWPVQTTRRRCAMPSTLRVDGAWGPSPTTGTATPRSRLWRDWPACSAVLMLACKVWMHRWERRAVSSPTTPSRSVLLRRAASGPRIQGLDWPTSTPKRRGTRCGDACGSWR